ncbi:MAG TPA: CAP domain-containing protein, partial [Kofleriaceae bacterium]|nr:CAP domain-containing protein [Kofleriaceae bacterium]
GCSSSGPKMVGAQPSWRDGGGGAPRTTAPGPVTFAPSHEPASRYNEPAPPPRHTPLGDAVLAAVREAADQAHLPAPAVDGRLFRACAELAEIVPEEGVIGYSFVEFALQRNGIIEPSPHLLVVWGPVDAPQPIVEQLKPRLAELLADSGTARVGIGAAARKPDGTGAIVFALQSSGVATTPIPRSLPASGSVTLDAVVDGRFRDPEVFVTHDDGATQRLALGPGRPGGFTAQLACAGHKGRQQVEIAASDAAGSTVLANFPLWCGVAPPASVTIEPGDDDAPVVSPDKAERAMLDAVNRDRAAAGLGKLDWDDRLAAVARAHSAEMQRTHVVAHISPTTGSAADRIKAAHIKTGMVLENVARAYGVREAHQGLMNSPGHRANLMSPVANRIGIGVVLGDEVSGRREMFVTQVLTRTPPKVDRGKTVEAVRKKIAAVRPKLVAKADLAGLAQQLADALAGGATREAAYQQIKPRLDALNRTYKRVASVITASADIDGLDGASLLGDTAADDVGIAIAQGPHPELGDNAVWVVLLLASERKP